MLAHRTRSIARTWLTRFNRRPVVAALVAVAAGACGSAGGWSRTIVPELPIEGLYQWLDAYDSETGCQVRILTQGDQYRGWVVDDPEQSRECPWYGYELYEFEVQGRQVRVRIHRAYGSSPYTQYGSGQYLFDLVPRVSLKGRALGVSGVLSEEPRWHVITLLFVG